MRPQGFKYTIGNTLLAGDGVVANIPLLRPGDMPTFDAAEVHAFDLLSRHLTRALQMGVRLERAENAAAGTAASTRCRKRSRWSTGAAAWSTPTQRWKRC